MVQHCRDTLVSADRCYRAIRHDFVTPNIVEKRRQIIWKLTFAVPCCKISAPSDIEKAIYFAAPERVVDLGLVAYPCAPVPMFSRLFTLALLVLVDLPVDAAAVLNSDLNRMEETRKEYEEGLKTYRKLAQKYPESYLPEVAQTLNNLGIVDIAQNRAEEARKAFEEALKIYREQEQKIRGPICLTWRQRSTIWGPRSRPEPAGGGPEGARGDAEDLP